MLSLERPSNISSASSAVRTMPGIWSAGDDARHRFRSLVPGVLRLSVDAIVVGLCGTLPGEGTSTMAIGLAVAIAEAGHTVVVLDAHAARPNHLASAWNAGSSSPQPTPAERALLDRVTLGTVNEPVAAEAAGGLKSAVIAATRRARVTLLDLEPVRESTQTLGLANAVDAIYLVVEAQRERREAIARSVETLTRVGLPVAGVLLNKRPRPLPQFLYRWL
jgi:receptor protein-tyrosine kinase